MHPAAAAAAFPPAAAGRQARTVRAAPRPAGRNLGPVAEANLFSRVARIFKSYANAAGAGPAGGATLVFSVLRPPGERQLPSAVLAKRNWQ